MSKMTILNVKKYRLSISLLCSLGITAMLLAAGCSDDMRDSLTDRAQGQQTLSVPVTLSVAGMDRHAETPSDEYTLTRSGLSGESRDVRNLLVLQFDGSGDAAPLVGAPTYIADYQCAGIGAEGDHSLASLVIAEGRPQTVVFVANTFDQSLASASAYKTGYTLADFKKKTMAVASESDLLHEDGGTLYSVMSGMTVMADGISQSSVVTGTLKRNMARVTVNLTLSTSDITIDHVQMCAVPMVQCYLTNCDLPEVFPTVQYRSFNYPKEAWTAGTSSGSSDPKTQTYDFYVPCDMRGTVESTIPMMKPTYVSAKAMSLRVWAHDNTTAQTVRSYIFYLGENLTYDCNLKPNGHYTYNLDIKAKGDPDMDRRIIIGTGTDDLGSHDEASAEHTATEPHVDYTAASYDRANSYILNPSATPSAVRSFAIPTDRINMFWGDAGYENDYTIINGTEYEAYILWSDFDNTDGRVSLYHTKFTDSSTGWFGVNVKQGADSGHPTCGNIIVAVRNKQNPANAADATILWSWHLWITDYQPDDVTVNNVEIKTDQYSYPVTGGKVHHYVGGAWADIYAQSVIMDRYLGAVDTHYRDPLSTTPREDGRGGGILYYQFGRKDPFPATLRWEGGTSMKTSALTYVAASLANPSEPGKNVPYSVTQPNKFITGASDYAWTYGDIYNPLISDPNYNNKVIWYDPSVTSPDGKSLFDPCPTGWKMPATNTWADFRVNNDANPSTNIAATDLSAPVRGFPPFESEVDPGLYYWPYISAEPVDPDNIVYYPRIGYRTSSSSLNSISTVGWCGVWYSNAMSKTETGYRYAYFSYCYANFLGVGVAGFIQNLVEPRVSSAFPVRCVRM